MSRSEVVGEAVLVLTSLADDASARKLSLQLVEEGLAACVTRSAVSSVFRWEPAAASPPVTESNARPLEAPVCEENEILLVIKTARHRVVDLERRLLELHPYECPELIRIAPEHVEAKYLAWLLGVCGSRD